ncbi:signal recognition particle subunit [Martiniozyma asiatica (nom. inval.)]|nr:signal recognition particle subunit [Martiniozyma asiatica]
MDTPIDSTYGERFASFLQTSDDFAKQRKKVNKRLAKLKKNLKIHTKDTQHYKEKEKVSSITSEKYLEDKRYGEVLLLICERDLLHAQETRLVLDLHTSRPMEKFMVSKLKKAFKNGKKLLDITQKENLEILAFVAIIEGLLWVSNKKWSKAAGPLSVARCGLQCLHAMNGKQVYYDLMDEVVEPALKVALLQGFKKGSTEAASMSKIFASKADEPYLVKTVEIIKNFNPIYVTASEENETMVIDSIKWSEYTAQLRNEDIALAIMKAQGSAKSIIESDPASFDSALLDYQDAIAIHEEDMKRNDEDQEDQEQFIVLTYLKYNAIFLKIRRDIALLTSISTHTTTKGSRQKSLESLRDTLQLIDNITVYISEMMELPGVANSEEIFESLTTLQVYFETQKLVNLAQGYLISNKYVEALALMDEAQSKIENSEIKQFQIEFGGNLPTNETLSSLKNTISQQLKKLYVLSSYFSNVESVSSYAIDDLKKFPRGDGESLLNNIAPLKPVIKAVPVKPVLFDIAFNYIGYGNELEVEQVSAGKGAEDQKKGFFGLFR